MNWIFTTLQWYVMLLSVGLLVLPLTRFIFHKFSLDFGYSFAKVVGLLLLTYIMFVIGVLHILPFNFFSLAGILIVLGILNIALVRRFFMATRPSSQQIKFWIGEEVLFVAALFFWTFVRGQEPSIHGLEKFMDFGFMNSILRTKFFPPLDMWLSADPQTPNGYFINYYYFGHLTGAILIKLSTIAPEAGYNLILATIFALGITQTFSFVSNLAYTHLETLKNFAHSAAEKGIAIFFGALGAFVLNLGGNLHTIYLFTSGYPNESPVPFWQILGGYHPEKYWYPNATRFIPFTIHEFPSYSYVVADLHGHVFDIPYVLLTLALLFLFFTTFFKKETTHIVTKIQKSKVKNQKENSKFNILNSSYYLLYAILFGFLCAVHYMTNAFDGPIYILLVSIILFLVFRLSQRFIFSIATLLISFVLFSLPFTVHYQSFVTKIGVNCSPEFLTNMGHLGPFLFEKGNCQSSAPWMLFILWGFFWITGLLFIGTLVLEKLKKAKLTTVEVTDIFVTILFMFSTFLIIVPEFFYAKDIYPAHFRANTMFKLGYQAFMMMSIAAMYTLLRIKTAEISVAWKVFLKAIYIFFLFFVVIYPFYATPSYYGREGKQPELDGLRWMETQFPENREVIRYFNENVEGQPVILEAQGDSYTDFDQISAYTGLPTVAGWWVHEWLWRGSSDVVGKRIPDIVNIYESTNYEETKTLLKKYHVQYIIISNLEKQKYTKLNKEKLLSMGKVVFQSPNGTAQVIKISD